VIKTTPISFNEKELVKLEELIADQGHHLGLFSPQFIKQTFEERPAAVKEDERRKGPKDISVPGKP
jgi:hypothetical protein